MCVPCVTSQHCTGGLLCVNNLCVPPCIGVEGCADEGSQTSNECGTAKVMGRTTLFTSDGYMIAANTTSAGNDDDLATTETDCFDGKYDQFYRFYMKKAETITVTADPVAAAWDFDIMLKLYAGTTCKAGGSPISCTDDGYDGASETVTHSASADGWYTVVVDGRLAFADAQDYGAYNLVAKLMGNKAPLCCQ